MFLTFDPNTGLSFNTYRNPTAEACSDVTEFADNYENNICSVMSVEDLHHDVLYPLEDGSLWAGSNVTKHTLEDLHSTAVEYLRTTC